MASKKVSALTALTTAGSDDLLYIADTSNSGSSYASKRITVGNFLNGYATESYVATQVANVIDSAPGALDTLNELAAALGDDASFSTTITNLINANETHIDNVATLSGVAKDGTSLGTFSGSTIADNQTIKAAIQALETAVEAAGSATSLAAVVTDASDLQTLTGIADGNSDLGTFSGSTIADSSDIKTALQALETALEAADSLTDLGVTSTATELNVLDGITATTAELNYVDGVTSAIQTQIDGKVATGANVNTLVGSTSAGTVPTSSGEDNYLFLVVDKSSGNLVAIDKTFLEAEGQVGTAGVSFAFTPSLTFDGSTFDSARQYFSSGDDLYDDYGINQINIKDSDIIFYFASTSDLNDWRASDRSFSVDYTGTASTPSWDGEEFDLTSSTEDTVNTSSNYIQYLWSDLGLTDSESDDLAQKVAEAGDDNTVLDIDNLG